MATFMIRFSYSPEAWAALLERPQDRRRAAKALAEQLGGRLRGFWYGFGEHDGYAIIEGPDSVGAAAGSIALAASGGFRSLETTVLLSVEETLEALRKAHSIAYAPPGKKPRGE
jgi:uncharacterized protein with GYD domain